MVEVLLILSVDLPLLLFVISPPAWFVKVKVSVVSVE